jgi:hypothetical protein
MISADDIEHSPLPSLNRGVTAAQLQQMEFPPIAWTVDGYIAEGLTVLAGKPKVGKSWLALDIALAVARGDLAIGTRQCAQGAVLYAALEDTARRLKDRLEKVHPPLCDNPWPANLTFWTFGEMERLDAGGIDQLTAWLAENTDAKLIIIDTLAKVRGGGQRSESAYNGDYREVGLLKALADETGVSIILITHTRKMGADDPFDTVSGTLGITGSADTTVILSREAHGTVLRATGRDVQEIAMAVTFDRILFRWREVGDAGVIGRSKEREEILELLFEALSPMTGKEIATGTGQKYANVRGLLLKMVDDEEVCKAGRGKYVHPDNFDNDDTIDTNNNNEECAEGVDGIVGIDDIGESSLDDPSNEV